MRCCTLRHDNGRRVVALYGPPTPWNGAAPRWRSTSSTPRAATSTRTSSNGSPAREGISLRTGCFCNPGAGEVSLGLSKPELEACFLADAPPDVVRRLPALHRRKGHRRGSRVPWLGKQHGRRRSNACFCPAIRERRSPRARREGVVGRPRILLRDHDRARRSYTRCQARESGPYQHSDTEGKRRHGYRNVVERTKHGLEFKTSGRAPCRRRGGNRTCAFRWSARADG